MGKLVKGHPGYSGTIMTATHQIARELGWSYFEKLAKQKVLQVQSATEPPKRLEAGERAVAVDGSDYLFWMAKERGLPIEVVLAVEGTPQISNPMGIFKSAPNPNAARLLVSWIMSGEGQSFIVNLSGQYAGQQAGQAEGRPAAPVAGQDLQGRSGRGREAGRPDQGAVREVLQGMTANASGSAFLPGEAGEVPRRGGGVMSYQIACAHDPSVADYRATSPRWRAGRNMTTALCSYAWRLSEMSEYVSPTGQEERRTARLFDASRPVLFAVAALLAIMIVLPMGWLMVYAFATKDGQATLGNFVTLFTDPSFFDPLVTTLIISVSVSVICCVVAAPMGWLVARTDMPLSRTVRTLVMASLVTPPFVGAVAWEMLAAPNSGLLNQLWRLITGAPADESLFDIYTLEGLIFVIACYTFPYVFILVANALDRMPGELEDASSMLGAGTWATARRITVPLALPTLLAGALVAFLQALNLFGSPAILAIPAGFHTLTTKIWSLFQFPPKPELASAAALPLLVLTVALLRAQALVLGRRGYAVLGGKYGAPRLIRLGVWRWPAVGSCPFSSSPCRFSCPMRPCSIPRSPASPRSFSVPRPSPCTMWSSRSGS